MKRKRVKFSELSNGEFFTTGIGPGYSLCVKISSELCYAFRSDGGFNRFETCIGWNVHRCNSKLNECDSLVVEFPRETNGQKP